MMEYNPCGGWVNEVKTLLKTNKNLVRQYNKLFKPHVEPIKRPSGSLPQQSLYITQRNGELWLKILPELRKRKIDPVSFMFEVDRPFLAPKKTLEPKKRKWLRNDKLESKTQRKKVLCVETGEVYKSIYALNEEIGYPVGYTIRKGRKIRGKTYKILEN